MSDKNKNRYEMQKIVRNAILDGLSKYIGANHGFDAMEFAQASFVKANRVVLMNLVRSKRVGWQGIKYGINGGNLKRTDEWIEEQSWQLQVIIKKLSSPQITDLQADDVASMLITYFNGVGADFLRKSKVAPLRIDNNSVIVYNDDSELYQKRAVFTVKLQVPKELTIGQDELSSLKPNVKPV